MKKQLVKTKNVENVMKNEWIYAYGETGYWCGIGCGLNW